MARMEQYQGFSIYFAGSSPAKDIVIFTHGGYTTKNAKYTKVPADASVYFYTFRGAYGTDAQTRAMLGNADPKLGVTSSNTVMTQQQVDTGIKSQEGNPIMANKTVEVPGGFGDGQDRDLGQFKMADGRVTSIAGPGSKIWDYDLSYNESSERIVKMCDGFGRTVPGWIARDVFVFNQGGEGRLSTVFKLISGLGYERYHTAFCRVQSETGQAPYDSGPKLCG
jgi:hypothetical protein